MSGSTILYNNDTKTVVPGAAGAVDFVFKIPAGGVAKIIGSSFFLTPDSAKIRIFDVKIRPMKQSRPIEISQGTPNIKEYAGQNGTPGIFPVIEIGAGNSEMLVTVVNDQAAGNIEVSLTHIMELIDELDDPAGKAISHLIVNQTKVLSPGEEDNFVFTVPADQQGIWRQVTGHLFTEAAGPESSNDIIIKEISFVRAGETQRTAVLIGTMNFNEFFGNGNFSRQIEVLQRLAQDSDLIIRMRNRGGVSDVEVSATAWFQTLVALGEDRYVDSPDARGSVPVNLRRE